MELSVPRPQRYHAILSYTGLILLLAGLVVLTPLMALAAWPGEWVHSPAFLLPGLALCGAGAWLWRGFRPRATVSLTLQEGGVVVLLSWVLACLVSAVPFMAVSRLSFTQAVFESVSGWTTTGLSVVDVTRAPRVILLWRSIMQLAGGAGLAILMLAALAGPLGSGLYAAERSEQLVPHVRRSAGLVMGIYSGYALVGVLAYWLAGMTPFDAVNHSFAAVSTGGFATHPESIGYWDSPAIEGITIFLMVLGNLNFLTAYVLVRGKLRTVCRNGEVRLMGVLIPVCSVLLFALVCRGLCPTLGKSVRVAIFETVTALTTTGFSTVTYANWAPLGILVLIVLMLIGGGACSTAGGIKQYRVYLLFKTLVWEVRRAFLPRTAVVEHYVWQGERKDFISDQRVRQVATFVFFYLTTYVVGAGVLAACGCGLKESLFEFASALGTVGLSVGVTAPDAPSLVLWTETFGMFLGRLEFFIIFTAVIKLARDASGALRAR